MVSLREILETDGNRTYVFARLRSDGLELDALHITTNTSDEITAIEILHNIEGDCAFSAVAELLHCTAWESEAAAQESSDWSRHYPRRIGVGQGNRTDALRIFKNLETVIGDSYLRHVLRKFIRFDQSIIFDAELYRLAQPKPLPPPVEEPAVEPRITIWRRIPQSQARIVIASIITLCTVVSVFLFLLSRNPELPPLSFEMRQMTEARLLPALPLAQVGYAVAFEQYVKETKIQLEAFAEESAKIDFTDTDTFLDALYPLDQVVQISTFHDKVMRNDKITDKQRAEILRRLYSDNLTFVVVPGDGGFIPFTFDRLRVEQHTESLVNYIFYLNRTYPKSAVALEGLFILLQILETQRHLSVIIFHQPEIRNACEQEKFAWLTHPNEAITICATFKRYAYITEFSREQLEKIFITTAVTICEEIAAENSYRFADAVFKRELLRLEGTGQATDILGIFTKLRKLKSRQSDPDFFFKVPYTQFMHLIEGKGGQIPLLGKISENEKSLDQALKAANDFKAAVNRGNASIAAVKSLEATAWDKWKREHAEKLQERKKKLSSQKQK